MGPRLQSQHMFDEKTGTMQNFYNAYLWIDITK